MRAISGVCVCVFGPDAASRVMRLDGWAVDGLSYRNAQANVEAVNNDGVTALMLSAQNGRVGCLRELLAAKVHSCAMRMRTRGSTVRTRLSHARCGLSQGCVCVCQGAGGVSRDMR